MRPVACSVVALWSVLCLALPAAAQFAGGLPGLEHTLARVQLMQSERVVVNGDVVHYRFDVVVGTGPLDSIRIHRVVKEAAPGRPVRKMEGVMLLPGAPQLFTSIFLPAAAPGIPAEEGSIALFLASNGVDVWGMDYGWGYLPYPTTDFSALRGWGFAKDAEHVQIALSIARWLRVTSGQGIDPIHLLGFSYGGIVVYAVAAEDTQRPGNLKNVKGIIPVDGNLFKVPPGSAAQVSACNALPGIVANLAAGMLANESGGWRYGEAALLAPDAPSVLFPPFTNYQAAQARMVAQGFLGGSYTTSPPSVTLFYTDPQRIVNLSGRHVLEGTPPYPYTPYYAGYEGNASRCESDDYPVTLDDHLADVAVPILYIARQDAGLYTTTRTASTDVTPLVVNPTLSPALYGHADFFLANDAASVIWRPILEWIGAHR